MGKKGLKRTSDRRRKKTVDSQTKRLVSLVSDVNSMEARLGGGNKR